MLLEAHQNRILQYKLEMKTLEPGQTEQQTDRQTDRMTTATLLCMRRGLKMTTISLTMHYQQHGTAVKVQFSYFH